MGKERLDKLIAATGYWSRREVKKLVREGRVMVNGAVVRSAEEKANPTEDIISVDGEQISCGGFTYIMLHKPAGVLSACEDRRQPTVLDLLEPALRRRELFPVGRLDKDTEGLLLLTNDGPMAHRLLSPKKHVDKVYYAELDGPVGEEDVKAFREGVSLGEEQCLPAELKWENNPSKVFVTLHEGKFHQIKRMFQSRGRTVLYLKRMSMGTLSLDPELGKGEYRYLSAEEIAKLRQLTGELTTD